MQPVIDLATKASSLNAFLLSDEVLDKLSEVELAAARDALSKAKYADSSGEFWSAINHLETAEHAFKRRLKSNTLKTFHKTKWMAIAHRLNLTMVLQAVAYKTLGEEKLKDEAVERLIQYDAELFEFWRWTRPHIAGLVGLTVAAAQGYYIEPVGCVFCFRAFLNGKTPDPNCKPWYER